MTSINLERRRILCTEAGGLPLPGRGNSILLVTAGLDALPHVEVSGSESERAGRMESESARRFLAARRLVRGLFSNILSLPAGDIGIAVDRAGKPYLIGNTHHFSITHCGDAVAVAVSELRVGVDLEAERPVDAGSLARRFFSREEADFVSANPTPADFFRLWTCREAAVKADGRGLSKLLGVTAVSTGGNSCEGGIEVRLGHERWTACHWNCDGRLHLALAFPIQEIPLVISWYDLRGHSIL